jgi:hypothetical protein
MPGARQESGFTVADFERFLPKYFARALPNTNPPQGRLRLVTVTA